MQKGEINMCTTRIQAIIPDSFCIVRVNIQIIIKTRSSSYANKLNNQNQ